MNRKKLLLSVLIMALALSVVYSFWKMPRQKTVQTLTITPGVSAKAKKVVQRPPSGNTAVRLDLLDRQSEAFSGFRRNIFGQVSHEKKARSPKRRAVIAGPGPSPAPPQIPQPSPIQRDMAQFTFLGFLKKENRQTVFLTGNNEIFLVRKGDTIAGRYRVANITDEMLSVRTADNGEEIIIPLIENRPLTVTGQ